MKNIFGLDGTFGSCNMQNLTLNYMVQRNETRTSGFLMAVNKEENMR